MLVDLKIKKLRTIIYHWNFIKLNGEMDMF